MSVQLLFVVAGVDLVSIETVGYRGMVSLGRKAMGVESEIGTLRPDPRIGCLSFRDDQFVRRQSHRVKATSYAILLSSILLLT